MIDGRSDVRRVKETRRHFEKMSADMDSALVRNAQAARSKAQDCDDAHNYLTAMTSGFYHTALDYVFQVSLIRQQSLESMLARKFYSSGINVLKAQNLTLIYLPF